ncbi:putative hscarg dehydrogenase [Trichoderma chlorosporum]
MPKIIAIIGATGTQGGSIISALQNNPAYKLRALTRNPDSDKAKTLAAQGIEVVAADVKDESSLEKAFSGASVIFAVTDFFEPFDKVSLEEAMEMEYQQGVNIARAASKVATLKLYIWSTLPNSTKLSDGAITVPHMQAKTRVDEYIKSELRGSLLEKTIFFWVTFYASNLDYATFTPFYAKPTGKYLVVTPVSTKTKVVSLGALSNIGTAVSGLLENDIHTFFAKKNSEKNTSGGKYILLTTDSYTMDEYYSTWAKATGKDTDAVKVLSVSFEHYEALFAEWGTEMGLMVKFWELVGEKSWQIVGTGDVLVDVREVLGTSRALIHTKEAFAQLDWKDI